MVMMVVLKAKEDAREEVEALKIMACVTIGTTDRSKEIEKVAVDNAKTLR